MAYEGHLTTICLGANRVPSRALGADEEHTAAISNDGFHERVRVASHRQALLKIDDVDFVSFAEDEGCHLRVPVTGLMTKMHASLKHLAHSYVCHVDSPG